LVFEIKRTAALLGALACILGVSSAQVSRDRIHQPNKVMDAVGLREGMVIGEVGAGSGYFTFHLARRVGDSGKVYANDISRSALDSLQLRNRQEGLSNIETILGESQDPLLPPGLDMVFIVNAFHDITHQVPLLNNLAHSLKPGAAVIIVDRDPDKIRDSAGHFLTRSEVLEKIEESVFHLDRIETFLDHHSIYIIRMTVKERIEQTEYKGLRPPHV
jgi:ubiquinone/menaquinone biosynthesis C-methylase UbiE